MYLKPMEKVQPTPDQLGQIRTGAEMANMLPYIKVEAEGRMHGVQNRVFMAIAQGKLTPELAMTAWHEMAAYRNMLKSYETHVKVGVSLAEKHSQSINNLGE